MILFRKRLPGCHSFILINLCLCCPFTYKLVPDRGLSKKSSLIHYLCPFVGELFGHLIPNKQGGVGRKGSYDSNLDPGKKTPIAALLHNAAECLCPCERLRARLDARFDRVWGDRNDPAYLTGDTRWEERRREEGGREWRGRV